MTTTLYIVFVAIPLVGLSAIAILLWSPSNYRKGQDPFRQEPKEPLSKLNPKLFVEPKREHRVEPSKPWSRMIFHGKGPE